MSADLTKIAAQVMAAIHASGASKDLDLTNQIVDSGKSRAYRLMTNYDWMFLRSQTTHSGGSVLGTSTYTLIGTTAIPCGKIISVKYGTRLVDYVPQEEYDRRIDGIDTTNYDVSMWTISGYSSAGFPVIQFFGTPAANSDAITYRYQRRIDEADSLNLMPGYMLDIVRLELLSEFYPYPDKSAQYRQEADDLLNASLWSERVKHNLVTQGVISRDRMQGNLEANRFASRHRRGYSTGS